MNKRKMTAFVKSYYPTKEALAHTAFKYFCCKNAEDGLHLFFIFFLRYNIETIPAFYETDLETIRTFNGIGPARYERIKYLRSLIADAVE